MDIYLFRDDANEVNFAFSLDITGANLPLLTPHTEWTFLEVIDTLKFVAPWDIKDFDEVLKYLRSHGYYLFEGELIDPVNLPARPDQSADR